MGRPSASEVINVSNWPMFSASIRPLSLITTSPFAALVIFSTHPLLRILSFRRRTNHRWHRPNLVLGRGKPLAQRKSTRLLWLLLQLLQLFLQHLLFLLLLQLGDQETELHPHAPGRRARRIRGIAVELSTEAHRLRPELHDPSVPAAKRHPPPLAPPAFPLAARARPQ